MSERLSKQSEVYLPEPCAECTPQNQRYYFRSFTDQSHHLFKSQNANHEPFEIQVYDRFPAVPRKGLDKPGTLWTSADPVYAYAVGISRGIVEKQPIYFMSFNYCGHDYQQGVEPFEVVGVSSRNPEFYFVQPITPDKDYRNEPHSTGTVFPFLTERQLHTAVWFQIPQTYMQDLSPRIFDARSPDKNREVQRVFRTFYNSQNVAYMYDVDLFMHDMNENHMLEQLEIT